MANDAILSDKARVPPDSAAAVLDAFDQGVEKSLELLQQLDDIFRDDESDLAARYKQRLAKVRDLNFQPHATIGVIGVTGVGKSHCINALLEQDLLPTSDSGACTAAPTEILYNNPSINESELLAEIHFITEEQWTEELKLLIDDVSSHVTNVDWNSIKNDSSDGPVKRAFDKIQAVYPNVTSMRPDQITYDDLLSDGIKEKLGSKVSFESNDIEQFRQQLQSYTGCHTNEKEEQVSQHWPLIAKILIFSRASILESGVRLVDLPGMYDNNTARAAVAEKYLDNCSSVLVMTPISRAKDSKPISDFLKGPSARQLRLNGTLHHVTVVCTKSDTDLTKINIHNMRRLPEALCGLRKRIEKLERLKHHRQELKNDREQLQTSQQRPDTRAEDCSTTGKKRKSAPSDIEPPQRKSRVISSTASTGSRPLRAKAAVPIDDDDDDGADDEDGYDVNDDVEVEDIAANHCDNVVHESSGIGLVQAIITESSLNANLLRIEGELHDLETDIEATLSGIRHEQIVHRNQHSKKEIQNYFGDFLTTNIVNFASEEGGVDMYPTSVFCVSSEGYTQLRSKDEDTRRDATRAGFLNEDDTEIPALRQHCVRFAVDTKMRSHARFFNALCDVINSLKLSASDDIENGKIMETASKNLEAQLKDLLDGFEKVLEKSVTNLKTIVQDEVEEHIHKLLQKTMSEAVTLSSSIRDEWDKIHGNIFAAIVRHDGYWISTHGFYDLNADLMWSFADPLDKHWTTFFDQTIPEHYQKAALECIQCIRKVDDDILDILQSMGASNTNHRPSRISIHCCCRQGMTYRNKILRVIEENMASAYGIAALEKGVGSSKRMRQIIETHLQEIQTSMFEKAVAAVQQSLSTLLESSSEKLHREMKMLSANHAMDHTTCVTSSHSKVRVRKIIHSTGIHPMLSDFESNVLEKLLNKLRAYGYADCEVFEDTSSLFPDEC